MEANDDSVGEDKKPDRWRPLVLLLVIVSSLILYQVFGLGQYLGSLRDWIKGMGTWGPIVFVFLYGGAVVVAVPGVRHSAPLPECSLALLSGSYVSASPLPLVQASLFLWHDTLPETLLPAGYPGMKSSADWINLPKKNIRRK